MRVLLACGGSGGHVFPAFSIAEELEKNHMAEEIIYVCGNKDIEHAIFKIVSGKKVLSIQSAPFRGKASLINPFFILKLLTGFVQSMKILIQHRPKCVIGFGGYFSFPIVFTAKCFGIKTLIHEQNVIPGVANRLLVRWVDGVALSFAETQKYLKCKRLIRVTGNPVRRFIEIGSRDEALRFFDFAADRKTLLVLGGSQGAESINANFFMALLAIPEAMKKRIQVLHLCGKASPAYVETVFKKNEILGRAYSFFERMDLVYAVADMAIGRAGATFLAEIGVKNIPAILVPYPHGDGHQLVNAEIFSQTHAAVVIRQEGLTPLILSEALENFLKEENQVPKSKANAADPARTLFVNFIQEAMR